MAKKKSIKHGPRFKDISGKRFGRLTVLSLSHSTRSGRGTKLHWKCRCDCGNDKIIPTGNLTNGHTKSCGCYNIDKIVERNTKHGLWPSPEFESWQHAKDRCFNPRNHAYARYGGRGITMSDVWRYDFERFFADMGPRPSPKHTLDRINNDGNYEPGNCRWADWHTQRMNRRPTKKK